MMKDAEMTRRLQEALNCLEAINLVPLRATDAVLITQVKDLVQPIRAALEDPPLAEVEGRLVEQATIWVLLPIGLEHSDFTTLPDGNCDVTVTIRGRGDVPEPPATSSSIR